MAAALVVDRSGSMAGRKLDLAKTAAERAASLLSGHDHLAVVAYDDSVDVVHPAAAATPTSRQAAIEAVHQLDARGTTNLSGGWLRGAEQAQGAPADCVKRVMLLSDGLAKIGRAHV